MDKLKWQGQIISRIEGDRSVNVGNVNESERKSLIEKGILLKFKNIHNNQEDGENHFRKIMFNLDFLPETGRYSHGKNKDTPIKNVLLKWGCF